jgi:carnitine 3-dehydrogenase
MTAWWADLGTPDLTSPAVQKKIVDGVLAEVTGRSIETLSQARDALLVGLLELRARHG